MPPRFSEVWVPFNLSDLAPAESIPLSDLDAFIPFLTERWPPAGRPHRVELNKDGRPNPAGTDGYVVFRVPPPERPVDPDAPGIDWEQLRPKIPPRKRKPQE